MHNRFILTAFIFVVLLSAGAAIWVYMAPRPSVQNNQNTNNQTVVNTSVNSSSSSSVTVYLVKLNDNGESGMSVGCGDSLIPVERTTIAVGNEITKSLNVLFSLKKQIDAPTGLYNALYQSDLSVASAVIVDGRATVKLTGTMQLGGSCDDPRFAEQIRQTVLNVPGVDTTDITINNRTLDEATSGRG